MGDKKKNIEEIFKDNVKFELEDGSQIIGPGPCPLKVSDWMNFLTSLWSTYNDSISRFKSWKFTSVLMYFAMGTFILSIFGNIVDVNKEPRILAFFGIIIYTGVFIGSWVTIDFFGKLMDHKAGCRDAIYLIINSIIWGTLNDPDLIRESYYTVAQELHFKANKLIKELKLDK